MPLDRFFRWSARVARFRYLLGLDRKPEMETRDPRVLEGDPGRCAELEERNRLDNVSTNFAIGWQEWLADTEMVNVGREYVEELLLIGIPRTHYAYVLVAHDEDEPTPSAIVSDKPAQKRSGLHGKIVNLRFPSGGFLQPLYSPIDRLLTTLFFSDQSIRKNWSSPLDPGRERNGLCLNQHGDLAKVRSNIQATVNSANRLDDGTPDPIAILEKLHGFGFKEVFATSGVAGRQGIYVCFDDYPNPVPFFGESYAALHNFIKTQETTENEHTNCSSKRSRREGYFPGGQLIRTGDGAARISRGLEEWRAKRAVFNRRRYGIDRPTLVFGGFLVAPDRGIPGGLGRLDGVAAQSECDAEGPVGGQPVCDFPSVSSFHIESIALEETDPQLADPNEFKSPGESPRGLKHPSKSAEKGRDSDLCGAHAAVGDGPEGTTAVVSRILRAIYGTAGKLVGAIESDVEGRERQAQDLAAADGRNGVQGRHLDEVIERLTLEAEGRRVADVAGDTAEMGAGEFIRRVKRSPAVDLPRAMRTLPTPRIEQEPGTSRER